MTPYENIKSIINEQLVIPPCFVLGDYTVLENHLGAPVVDRSRTLHTNIFCNIIIEDELPNQAIYSNEFSCIVDSEVSKIHSRSIIEKKPIAIMYSGGLDSTCVACGFLKAGIAIKIVGSQASIDENLPFYNEVLLNNQLVTLDMQNPLLFMKNNIDNYLFVTGECGAHIMGTVSWKDTNDINKICEKHEYLSDSIFNYPSTYHDFNPIMKKQLMEIICKSPRNIKTAYDAHWWLIFVLKWQYVSNRLQMMIGKFSANLINFYMSKDFQNWATCNDVTVKCPNNDWKNYKLPMKDYIFSYTHNKESSYDIPPRASLNRTYPELNIYGKYVLNNPKKVGSIYSNYSLDLRTRWELSS